MKSLLFPLLCFIAMAMSSAGQAPHPTFVQADDESIPVIFGHSVIALTGPWRFHVGDDPRWADPHFDDSSWESYDLAPGIQNLEPARAPQMAALPGWQQHGHPGYTGYAWYRLRLQLPDDVDSPALLMPQHVDDAYEVYLNGAKIGTFGDLSGWPLSYTGQPQLFSIPAGMLRQGQPVSIALRFWNQRSEAAPGERNQAGGLRGVPLVGPSALLQVFERSIEQQMGQRRLSPGETVDRPWELVGLVVLYTAVGLISLFLFFFSRSHREYLWAGVSLVGFGAMLALFAMGFMAQTTIPGQLISVAQMVTYPAAAFAMPLAAMYLLEVPRTRWRRVNCLVAPINLAWSVQLESMNLGFLPPTAATEFARGLTLWLGELSLGCLLLAIAIDGVRTIGRKAWLPMTPGLLFAIYCLSYDLAVSGIFKNVLLGRFICASVPVSVLVIFLMRFTEQQRENVRMVDDMRQAQEVQHLLIPQHLPSFPGWLIESEYRPAQQVGGDFFQIIPHPSDGSILIVVGDVVGKGLQAGMTVAFLVGAIRNESEHTFDPIQILRQLNRRLLGQGRAQATCQALLVEENGAATLANAGHLPPYLNGVEMSIEGSLPLGMISEAEFPTADFHLEPGDRLMLISDGVVEAQDERGHLFGFDRVCQLMEKQASTAEVASAAQAFGQEDDITVLSLSFAPVGVAHV